MVTEKRAQYLIDRQFLGNFFWWYSSNVHITVGWALVMAGSFIFSLPTIVLWALLALQLIAFPMKSYQTKWKTRLFEDMVEMYGSVDEFLRRTSKEG